ncbi:MAG: 3'-5' exonuclease domain-containing protein 2 [Bacteroidales bacterium]|nr:3'-5' exonuclease domain-containing protein 2 [Bacteroidales bacterium]
MTKVYQAEISSEEVQKLPSVVVDGEVLCIDTMEKFNEVKDELFLESLWGVDTETRPCFTKGQSNIRRVALLQMSSREKTYIFRLNCIGFPQELVDIMSSSRFTKVGLSLTDDIRGLQKTKKFTPAGFIDLQSIAPNYGIKEKSLQKLAAIVLGCHISKSQRLTNWEAPELTQKQILYAATDSWITRKIYVELNNGQ